MNQRLPDFLTLLFLFRSDPELLVLLLAQSPGHPGWLSGSADGLAYPENDGQWGHPGPCGAGEGEARFPGGAAGLVTEAEINLALRPA